MSKSEVFAAVAAAIVLSTASASAMGDMEKCKIVKDGKGLIKEHKADCGTSSHDCGGKNKAGDPESYIMVPKGQCDKINKGDFSGVSEDIKAKIEGAK